MVALAHLPLAATAWSVPWSDGGGHWVAVPQPLVGVALAGVLALGRAGWLGVLLGAVLAALASQATGARWADWTAPAMLLHCVVAAGLFRAGAARSAGGGSAGWLWCVGPLACVPSAALVGAWSGWVPGGESLWFAAARHWLEHSAGTVLTLPLMRPLIQALKDGPSRSAAADPVAARPVWRAVAVLGLLALALPTAVPPVGLTQAAVVQAGLTPAVLVQAGLAMALACAAVWPLAMPWPLRTMSVRPNAMPAAEPASVWWGPVLDRLPVGLAVWDERGQRVQVNACYARIAERGAAELRAGAASPVWRSGSVETALPEAGVHRWRDASGRACAVQVSVWPWPDAAPGRPRWLEVVEDLGEALLARDAQEARRQAEAANQAKSEFLSRMSHELRTPLNAILGFSQLMDLDRRNPLGPQPSQWNQQLQRAGWHLLHMIDDVLDFSRIDTGHMRLSPEALEVQAVLDEAQSMVAQAAVRRGVTLAAPTGALALRLIGDATRVTQILTNLLTNAVKYNRPGGSVRIAVERGAASQVVIHVQDTGVGMTAAQLDQLFQPFNRLGREASGVEGHGIGLVIARRLAQLMGGDLRVVSTPGQGSTFSLVLPRAADDTPARRLPAPAYAGAAAYAGCQVLYIEDDEVNAEVMRGVLLQRPQVQLQVAATGRAGLERIRQQPPHLVLLDMNLPDMDGLAILAELRRDARTAQLPVVVVSADITEALTAAAQVAGATRLLGKPVLVPELLQALDECLEAPSVVDAA